jgi:hypothetical protein
VVNQKFAGRLMEEVDLGVNHHHKEPTMLPDVMADSVFWPQLEIADGSMMGLNRQSQGHLLQSKRPSCCDNDMEKLPGFFDKILLYATSTVFGIAFTIDGMSSNPSIMLLVKMSKMI